MDGSEKLEKVGIRKPTYEELESEYGELADRCEFAEKLNKSLEIVIVEKDRTIETFTREIDGLNKIIREKDKIVESLTDENKELKAKLDNDSLVDECIKNTKDKVNAVFGTMADSANDAMLSYKEYIHNHDAITVTETLLAKLKNVKEIVDTADHKRWEVVNVDGNDIIVQRCSFPNIVKGMYHVSNFGKTWTFVDEEVQSDEHNNS